MTHFQSLGWKDPLEEEMATHPSILAWTIPQRSLAGYSPEGHKDLDTAEHNRIHTEIFYSVVLHPIPFLFFFNAALNH